MMLNETCRAPLSDPAAFPSLSAAATPVLAARAPGLAPTRRQPAQQQDFQRLNTAANTLSGLSISDSPSLTSLESTAVYSCGVFHAPTMADDSNAEVLTLLSPLGSSYDTRPPEIPPILRTRLEKQTVATYQSDPGRLIDSTKVIWGVSRGELSKRYLNQQRTLLPMPSGIEGPSQVIYGPPITPLSSQFSTFIGSLPPLPRGPPFGTDTSCK